MQSAFRRLAPLLLCVWALNSASAEPVVIPLWPEGVPGLKTNAGPEVEFDGRFTNVHNPTITMYAPEVAKSAGVAVVFSPGGGYVRVSDGKGDARWLNSLGLTVFVLKYRLNDYGHPHELTIRFTNAVAMNGVALMNRQNDRDHLGDIRGYKLEASPDSTHWQNVAPGELPSTWNPQTIKFGSTVTAKSLKLTALSGYGNDASVALAELTALYAGPKLPENGSDVEYRRVRSTSSDVDEGAPPQNQPAPTP